MLNLFLLQLFGEGSSSSSVDSEIVAKVVGNRTDLVELVRVRNTSSGLVESQQYMVCDFTKWEKRSQHSKRDHCKSRGAV